VAWQKSLLRIRFLDQKQNMTTQIEQFENKSQESRTKEEEKKEAREGIAKSLEQKSILYVVLKLRFVNLNR
jgi:hypothetical protein